MTTRSGTSQAQYLYVGGAHVATVYGTAGNCCYCYTPYWALYGGWPDGVNSLEELKKYIEVMVRMGVEP